MQVHHNVDKRDLQLLLRQPESQTKEIGPGEIIIVSKITLCATGSKTKESKISSRQSRRLKCLAPINNKIQIKTVKGIC